ncbi:MAG: hypothetical protein HY071_03565 [Chloroflexi bacterium]|nr:hypothetical protein [Chloroflexota bacterium]
MIASAPRRFVIGLLLTLTLTILPFTLWIGRLAALGEVFAYGAPRGTVELHGTWFATDWRRYKLEQAKMEAPQLLVLGASAVQEFRSFMFPGCEGPGCFYNAAGAARPIGAARDVFAALSAEHPPRVLLLGLDYWQFNPEIQSAEGGPDRRPGPEVDYAIAVARSLLPLLVEDQRVRDVVLGRAPIPPRRRGLEAIVHGAGFRPDGSFAYPASELAKVSAQTPLQRDEGTRTLVNDGIGVYVRFSDPDPAVVADLEELLDLARRRGTTVVGFSNPVGDSVADAIAATPGTAAGFAAVRDTLVSVFARRGIPFVTVERTSEVGCGGEERWDGFHYSEVCTARLLARILDDPAARARMSPYTSSSYLTGLVSRRVGPLQLVP